MPDGPPSNRPRGTVSFLFTDIEGSTRLWEGRRAAMSAALERHDGILRAAIGSCGGTVFSTGGDGLAAAFHRAPDALAAAVAAQRALQAEPFDPPLRVRMAVHTGDVEERQGDYFGPPLNRCARLMAAAHGGQVLCSGIAASLVGDQFPEGARLRDLGSHRLRDLSEPEHVFQVEHPQLPSGFPPLRSLDSYRGNLPVQPTAFVGRDTEVTDVAKALEEARVVTLCGVGGVGKTRLALQVAASLLPSFDDGAWLVELAGAGSAEAVIETVAAVLGVQPAPGAQLEQALLDHLRPRSVLLVIDNCEHLLNPVAGFVDSVVRATPGVTVLATSREGLAVSGERLVTVPSLHTPDPDMAIEALVVTEAVRLFADRAADVRPGYQLTEEDAGAVAEICRRLDGIPLALELAAARMQVLSPPEIVEHLDRRFKLLTAGKRTAVSRHQTLQSTLDWSYDLLEDAERTVFRRMSVFAGDFELSVVGSVVSDGDIDALDVSDVVFRLVEKSLLVVQPGAQTTRYRFLETIRDYAWERLVEAGEAEVVAGRHAQRYLDLARALGAGLRGPEELTAKARIEVELDNLRSALRWAIDAGESEMALGLVDALANAGSIRAPFGTLALDAARMEPAAGHPLVAVAIAAAASAHSAHGENRRASELADEALALASGAAGSPAGDRALCHSFGNLAMVSHLQADTDRFIGFSRAWLAAARRLDDPFEISQALNLFGSIVIDPHEGLEALHEALAIARHLANPSRIAFVSIVLGSRLAEIDVDRAEAAFEEALEAAVAARNDWVDAFAASEMAVLQIRKGDLRGAARTLVDTLDRSAARGDYFALSLSAFQAASVLAALGQRDEALLLGSWGEQHGAAYDRSHPAFAQLGGDYEAVRETCTEAERQRFVQQASSLGADDVVAIAHRQVALLGDS